MSTLEYSHPDRCFRLRYLSEWKLEEEGDLLSFRKAQEGGAVTVSSVRHRDSGFKASAIDLCKMFVIGAKHSQTSVEGDAVSCKGAFLDSEGNRWRVRTVASGRYAVLATYNYSQDVDASERAEAVGILDTVEIVVSQSTR